MSGTPHREQSPGRSGPEVITNAAGTSMSPLTIEGKIKSSSPLIGHVVCIGDQRPYNVALIVLDPRARATFRAMHGLPDGAPSTFAADERVQDAVAIAIDGANEQLAKAEQIKRFAILPFDWWPGGDELTPTLKPRREAIAAKYADEIEWMYDGPGAPPE